MEGKLHTASSWNKVLALLQKAKNIAGDQNSPQVEINKIIDDLQKAVDDLVLVSDPSEDDEIDYEELEKLIEEAEELEEEIYTATSFMMVDSALLMAKAVRNSSDVTQRNVDHAAGELSEAIDNLELLLNFTDIDSAIEAAEQINGEDYKEASYNEMLAQLNNAKAVKENAISQEELDNATKLLNDAIDELELIDNSGNGDGDGSGDGDGNGDGSGDGDGDGNGDGSGDGKSNGTINDGLPGWAIALIVIGVFAFLTSVVLATAYIVKKKNAAINSDNESDAE